MKNFGQVYEIHNKGIYGIIFPLTGQGKVKTWTFRVVNNCLNYSKRKLTAK